MVERDDEACKVRKGKNKPVGSRTYRSAMAEHAQRLKVPYPDFVLMITMKVSNTDDEALLLTCLSRLYATLCSRWNEAGSYEQENDSYRQPFP